MYSGRMLNFAGFSFSILLLSFTFPSLAYPITNFKSIVARDPANPKPGFTCADKFNIPELRELLPQEGFNLRQTTNNPRKKCYSKKKFVSYNEAEGANEADIMGGAQNIPETGKICDHIIELNIVWTVLESNGGPCDQVVSLAEAVAHANADAKSIAEGIRLAQAIEAIKTTIFKSLNGRDNAIFVEKHLERQKSLVVSFALRQISLVPPTTDELLANKNKNLANRILAVSNYLSQTSQETEAVAEQLDRDIANAFPGTVMKVVDLWNDVLEKASGAASESEVIEAVTQA